MGKYIIHGWYGIYFVIKQQMVASFMVPCPAKEVLPTVVVYASALGPCGWNWALQLLGQWGAWRWGFGWLRLKDIQRLWFLRVTSMVFPTFWEVDLYKTRKKTKTYIPHIYICIYIYTTRKPELGNERMEVLGRHLLLFVFFLELHVICSSGE